MRKREKKLSNIALRGMFYYTAIVCFYFSLRMLFGIIVHRNNFTDGFADIYHLIGNTVVPFLFFAICWSIAQNKEFSSLINSIEPFVQRFQIWVMLIILGGLGTLVPLSQIVGLVRRVAESI